MRLSLRLKIRYLRPVWSVKSPGWGKRQGTLKPGTDAGIETAENTMLTTPTGFPTPDDPGEHGMLPHLIQRARAEFNEMPGLRLTVAQAARLWSLDMGTSATMLTALVGTGFLMKHGERYSRAGSA